MMKWVQERWLLLVLLVLAVVILISAAVGVFELAKVAVVLAALVAGVVALSVNQTVDQRRRDEAAGRVRERREEIYARVLEHLLSSFT